MRQIVMVAVLSAIAVACAGKAAQTATTTECPPVPAEFLTAGPVFRDCAVDRKAREPAVFPQLRMVDLPRRQSGCSKVVIEMVVDSTGSPVTQTAKVLQSNDTQFEQLVLSSIGALRYTPAMKDNQRVAQLVSHGRMIQWMVTTTSSTGGLPAQRPNRGNAPKC